MSTLTDNQLLRYSRHILLDEIGTVGQDKILNSKVLIIGAGGLGSPAALYLGSAGIGHIVVIDDDFVDETNLQRQIAHTMDRVGQSKVSSIAKGIYAINPDIKVTELEVRADKNILNHWIAQVDIILDCSDNFLTRHAVNAACFMHHKPLVSGAAIRMDGQVCVYDPRVSTSPCYACIFPPAATFEETRCATMGVFAPLVGIIGSLQAAEALKLICDIGNSLTGRLLMIDGRSMTFTEIQINRQSDCLVCGKH